MQRGPRRIERCRSALGSARSNQGSRLTGARDGGWKIGLLLMPDECERLREMGLPGRSLRRLSEAPSVDLTPAELYAALNAVSCPRLAFLLTNLEPRDPLDEELAKWKMRLAHPLEREEGGVPRLEVLSEGFPVRASDLEPLGEGLAESRERGGARLEAKVAVDRELAKLIELAEAGFETPEILGFFNRYIEKAADVKVGTKAARSPAGTAARKS